MNVSRIAAAGLLAAGAMIGTAGADVVTGVSRLEGEASIVGEGPGGSDVIRLRLEGQLGPGFVYGNVIWTPQTAVNWGQITTLSSTFKGEIGNIAGGGPRFSVWFDWNGNGELDPGFEDDGPSHLFVTWGPVETGFVETPTGDWQDTGNFVGDPSARFDIGQITDDPNEFLYQDYNRTVELVGDLRVLQIGLVLDAGWSQPQTDYLQQFLVDHVLIEGFTPDTGLVSLSTAPLGARAFAGVEADTLVPFREILRATSESTQIPEPASLLALGAGAALLLTRRSRRGGRGGWV